MGMKHESPIYEKSGKEHWKEKLTTCWRRKDEDEVGGLSINQLRDAQDKKGTEHE